MAPARPDRAVHVSSINFVGPAQSAVHGIPAEIGAIRLPKGLKWSLGQRWLRCGRASNGDALFPLTSAVAKPMADRPALSLRERVPLWLRLVC